eukprot:8902814-Lingulodinium_polyedra.AAC.1
MLPAAAAAAAALLPASSTVLHHKLLHALCKAALHTSSKVSCVCCSPTRPRLASVLGSSFLRARAAALDALAKSPACRLGKALTALQTQRTGHPSMIGSANV